MDTRGERLHLATLGVRCTCQYCGKKYPVESLARDCEEKHEQDE